MIPHTIIQKSYRCFLLKTKHVFKIIHQKVKFGKENVLFRMNKVKSTKGKVNKDNLTIPISNRNCFSIKTLATRAIGAGHLASYE